MKELYKTAGILNIEGGFPCHDLRRGGPGKWVNVIVVLDRPLVDHVLFDDLFANNPYPLLESALDELNEHHFLSVYLTLLGYYLENGRRITGKGVGDPLRVTVHFHQDVRCRPLVELVTSHLRDLVRHFGLDLSGIEVEYRTDFHTYANPQTDRHYEGTDLLISLSQCAGLDPALEVGALVLPRRFLPYEIGTGTVHVGAGYTVENDLDVRLGDVLASRHHTYAVDYVNTHYVSANPAKGSHRASPLSVADFKVSDVLQVDALWNPTDPDEIVSLDDRPPTHAVPSSM